MSSRTMSQVLLYCSSSHFKSMERCLAHTCALIQISIYGKNSKRLLSEMSRVSWNCYWKLSRRCNMYGFCSLWLEFLLRKYMLCVLARAKSYRCWRYDLAARAPVLRNVTTYYKFMNIYLFVLTPTIYNYSCFQAWLQTPTNVIDNFRGQVLPLFYIAFACCWFGKMYK